MPDRIIPTIKGPTGGLLVIVGVYLLGLGISWLVQPSTSREAGVEWINSHAWIPISGLSSAHVAWWWIIGGTLTLAGGLASRHAWAERTAIAAGIFCPALVAALFIGAWVDGTARTGVTSAWSYALPAVVIVWQVSRERRRVERGEHLHTGQTVIVGR